MMSGLFFAALFLVVLCRAFVSYADPIPGLSDKKFQSELIEMTSEYDQDAAQRRPARIPTSMNA